MATRKPKISFGVTAFIDVLGFGERVAAAATEHDVAEIVTVVDKIQAAFEYRTKDELQKKVHSLYKKEVLAFSDSIVIHVPLESEMTVHQGTFDPLMSELSAFALTQGELVLEGVFLRGGVDLGWWHRTGSKLVSASLLHAYKTENKADVPVLALTPNTLNFFEKHRHRDFYAEDIEPVSRLFKPYTTPKGDSLQHLDYIQVCLESVDWQTSREQSEKIKAMSAEERDQARTEGYRTNINRWLHLHARQIEAGHASAPAQAQHKYTWLADYHNAHAKDWMADPGSYCTSLGPHLG